MYLAYKSKGDQAHVIVSAQERKIRYVCLQTKSTFVDKTYNMLNSIETI